MKNILEWKYGRNGVGDRKNEAQSSEDQKSERVQTEKHTRMGRVGGNGVRGGEMTGK